MQNKRVLQYCGVYGTTGVLLYFEHWLYGLRCLPCSQMWCVKSGSERYPLNCGCLIDVCPSISCLGAFNLLNWEKSLRTALRKLPSCKVLSAMRSYPAVLGWLWCGSRTSTSLPIRGHSAQGITAYVQRYRLALCPRLQGLSIWVLGMCWSWVGLTLSCGSLTLPPLWEEYRLKSSLISRIG